MTHTREPENEVQFQWGKKRGIGGAKKDVQFYESFKYDGVEYALYDNVYLYKKGEYEPYIGKILKMWELADRKKKVKILWYFKPFEIQNYLGAYTPSEKEIFLASGEGVGLANINHLEAVAGKCRVICISLDERNIRPSAEELERADYVFKCTFDVQSLTILEKLPDIIAGTEVRCLINWKEDEKPLSTSNVEANGLCDHGETITKQYSPLSKSATFKDKGNDDVIERKENLQEAKSLLIVNEKGKVVKDECSHDHEKRQFSSKNCPISDDRPSKRIKVDDSVKCSDDLQENISNDRSRKPITGSGGGEHAKLTSQLHPESSRALKISQKKVASGGIKPKSSALVENKKKDTAQPIEVSRRPDEEGSKWFKNLPWDTRLQQADGQGKLVFLDNLDPSYSSGDVEDIIYHACNELSTAKVISHASFQNTNYGQAYVIFKTKEAADLATNKINKGCLLQSNGCPLICSKGLLKVPPKSSKLVGHLSIERVKLQMQREEMKKALSTSHCSQPNTIEYEMAMDWLLLQERFSGCYKRLFKDQSEEMKRVVKSLKNK